MDDLLREVVGEVLAFEIAHLAGIAADHHRKIEHGVMVGKHKLGNLCALGIGDNELEVVAELVGDTTLSGLAESCLAHLSDAVERTAADASLGLDAHLFGRDVFYLQAVAVASKVDDELCAVVAVFSVAIIIVDRLAQTGESLGSEIGRDDIVALAGGVHADGQHIHSPREEAMVALGKQAALACQDGSFPGVFHQSQLEHRGHQLDALELESSTFELDVENALAKILFLLQ